MATTPAKDDPNFDDQKKLRDKGAGNWNDSRFTPEQKAEAEATAKAVAKKKAE